MANLDDKVLEEEEVVVEEQLAEESETEEIVVEEEVQEEQSSKQKANSKNQNKKPSRVKGAFSELKKVTYPTFGKVVKQTAIVLAVTVVFMLVIFGIDQLLFFLNGLLPN